MAIFGDKQKFACKISGLIFFAFDRRRPCRDSDLIRLRFLLRFLQKRRAHVEHVPGDPYGLDIDYPSAFLA